MHVLLQFVHWFWRNCSDEYNDVRVNRLSLAALRVLDKPLPSVLKDRIMDPIGASSSWSWNGYTTSFVDLNGEKVQSVSGGGHWVSNANSLMRLRGKSLPA